MLQFDAETARKLDRAYKGLDFTRRRHANIAALGPKAGDRVLDIGCGTGLMLAELARTVGPEGHVTGIDMSPDMLATARRSVAGEDNVTVVEGSAFALPFPDASFDRVVSVQVFEYFDDLGPALRECARVLRPGGRLVIGDMHWDTLAWHSEDPGRMARMIDCWDGHLADRVVPARLIEALPEAGLAHRETIPLTFVDTGPRPDGLARMMQTLIERHALAAEHFDDEEARAWAAEQEALSRAGRFFFAITHMITVAERP